MIHVVRRRPSGRVDRNQMSALLNRSVDPRASVPAPCWQGLEPCSSTRLTFEGQPDAASVPLAAALSSPPRLSCSCNRRRTTTPSAAGPAGFLRRHRARHAHRHHDRLLDPQWSFLDRHEPPTRGWVAPGGGPPARGRPARMREGGLDGAFFSISCRATSQAPWPVKRSLEQIDAVRSLATRYPDRIALATTASRGACRPHCRPRPLA